MAMETDTCIRLFHYLDDGLYITKNNPRSPQGRLYKKYISALQNACLAESHGCYILNGFFFFLFPDHVLAIVRSPIVHRSQYRDQAFAMIRQ